MTSSAWASSNCGTVRPSVFAVLRLMTSSNLVGCWGLSQISGVDGSLGMAANFALRFGGPHDPECDCREAEAPVQGRLQGPALRGAADPAGGRLVSALSAQLPRH